MPARRPRKRPSPPRKRWQPRPRARVPLRRPLRLAMPRLRPVAPSLRPAGPSLLRVLQKHRYVGDFEQVDDGRSGKFRIQLLAKINKCGIITPRFSVKKGAYFDWERQFLPAYSMGILLVSTSRGIMSHHDAQAQSLGGVLVGYVY